MNKVITIPKGDFVIVPRKEYEELSELKKWIPVVKPTRAELRAIRRGEQEIERGEYVSWSTVKHDLEHRLNKNRKKTAV